MSFARFIAERKRRQTRRKQAFTAKSFLPLADFSGSGVENESKIGVLAPQVVQFLIFSN